MFTFKSSKFTYLNKDNRLAESFCQCRACKFDFSHMTSPFLLVGCMYSEKKTPLRSRAYHRNLHSKVDPISMKIVRILRYISMRMQWLSGICFPIPRREPGDKPVLGLISTFYVPKPDQCFCSYVY